MWSVEGASWQLEVPVYYKIPYYLKQIETTELLYCLDLVSMKTYPVANDHGAISKTMILLAEKRDT